MQHSPCIGCLVSPCFPATALRSPPTSRVPARCSAAHHPTPARAVPPAASTRHAALVPTSPLASRSAPFPAALLPPASPPAAWRARCASTARCRRRRAPRRRWAVARRPRRRLPVSPQAPAAGGFGDRCQGEQRNRDACCAAPEALHEAKLTAAKLTEGHVDMGCQLCPGCHCVFRASWARTDRRCGWQRARNECLAAAGPKVGQSSSAAMAAQRRSGAAPEDEWRA